MTKNIEKKMWKENTAIAIAAITSIIYPTLLIYSFVKADLEYFLLAKGIALFGMTSSGILGGVFKKDKKY